MNERYSRQTLFSPIGEGGQVKIQQKHVLLLGAGALGSANAEALTRAGVGKLTIVDRDYVETSNLQRQQLYTEQDVEEKLPKAEAAKRHLHAINHEVEVKAVIMDATAQTLEPLLGHVDLIMDATDNFETRMIINDLSQKLQIPWIYGACVGSVGMTMTILPGQTPCLHCLLKTIPIQGMTCDTGGIISPAVTMVVAHQIAEALKILVEDWESVRPSLVTFDLWRNQYQTVRLTKVKKKDCLSCGDQRTYPFLTLENATKTAVLCGRDTVQVRPPKPLKLQLEKLAKDLNGSGYLVKVNPFLLSCEKNGERMVVFQDGRALVHGTKDMVHAKAMYQSILG
ncbi:thiazole biosynthesis adenylyltransferase ThiF [Peribacillus butanolivorans]|uniref:thiazole biosynthesis adenylyltransferase ThiF n=1 Tax=Peribacillus butanolivorans TaxID=421767 RepID=UPI00167F1F3C|nr:thiazole biosynthesis adenylyltransferase ThiF [Peribacillus butanolivorans]MCO0596028.1 thiazole biosynthesis adenylyltransferase ThiF [Peribacillus butanolivorans]QNU02618.1 thiazole biosynthesis adenylyltransferase ThiF [Peribacillus butanolivorans]